MAVVHVLRHMPREVRPLFSYIANTGLRVSAALATKPDWIHWDTLAVHYPASVMKARRPHTAELNAAAEQHCGWPSLNRPNRRSRSHTGTSTSVGARAGLRRATRRCESTTCGTRSSRTSSRGHADQRGARSAPVMRALRPPNFTPTAATKRAGRRWTECRFLPLSAPFQALRNGPVTPSVTPRKIPQTLSLRNHGWAILDSNQEPMD